MIFFPPAKINIGLNILARRADGYHELETLLYPVGLYDAVEWVLGPTSQVSTTMLPLVIQVGDRPARQNSPGSLPWDSSPDRVETLPAPTTSDSLSPPPVLTGLGREDNLVYKAYKLLAADFALPELSIYLLKNIPIGAGLGGGSSDAVFMLKSLNNAFDLHLSSDALRGYARKIGSDCAFFVDSTPALATGRGEVLESYPVVLAPYWITVVKPPLSISTLKAYASVVPHRPAVGLIEAIKRPMKEWRHHIFNDFEQSMFIQHPSLKLIKASLYHSGALYASMSGSGSAIYGIFPERVRLESLEKENRVYYLKAEF